MPCRPPRTHAGPKEWVQTHEESERARDQGAHIRDPGAGRTPEPEQDVARVSRPLPVYVIQLVSSTVSTTPLTLRL
jgi:hypothetical protein